jgi:two-component system CheB/CheR fusion protein
MTSGRSEIDGAVATTAPGRRILVIEDNLDARQSLAEVLSLHGHEVHQARDGLEGIAMARALRPDVVLCDIGLPDVDGYHVARRLRGDEELRSTHLVALSGHARPEDRRRAGEAGFDAHLAKPPPLEELQRLLWPATDR